MWLLADNAGRYGILYYYMNITLWNILVQQHSILVIITLWSSYWLGINYSVAYFFWFDLPSCLDDSATELETLAPQDAMVDFLNSAIVKLKKNRKQF